MINKECMIVSMEQTVILVLILSDKINYECTIIIVINVLYFISRSRKISLGQPMHPPLNELLTLQRPPSPKPRHRKIEEIKKGMTVIIMKEICA